MSDGPARPCGDRDHSAQAVVVSDGTDRAPSLRYYQKYGSDYELPQLNNILCHIKQHGC